MKELLDNGSTAKGLTTGILSFPRIAQSFGPVDSLVEMYEKKLTARAVLGIILPSGQQSCWLSYPSFFSPHMH